MRCPYLQEAAVKSCHHAGFRPLVPGAGRCGSPEYARCAEWGNQVPADGATERCPYLDEFVMQYCSAAALRKFVPYNEAFLTRCSSGGYRYCEVFLDMAMPARAGAAFPPSGAEPAPEYRVDGILVPEWLFYSANHMWADLSGDGYCYLGIDGFFARALECVEEVSFLTVAGTARPAAVLTARGIDVPVVFPVPVRITASNLYLRADPARVTRDPYSLGWLFQGQEQAQAPLKAALLTGTEAPAWMRAEATRMSRHARPREREELLRFFHDFFSPLASRECER